MVNCDLMAQVKATASGQAPFATVVGCVDSRVPPELVFDQGIGDIFVARVAGNFVNTDIIGSLEFATQLVGSKLIVVLGHTDCGAVKGAVDNAQSGNLTATLANIRPAVLKTKGIEGTQDSRNKKLVQAVAEQNARDAVAMLLGAQRITAPARLRGEAQSRSRHARHQHRQGQLDLLTDCSPHYRRVRRCRSTRARSLRLSPWARSPRPPARSAPGA